jgi:methylenetetrahydrofolate--tRNA-(uracil-5-)-methyltransferase
MFDEFSRVTVIGGGLAGVEAAWQIAQRGIRVCLYEMRPAKMTPAHTTDRLAELVCSNSLGADQPDKAPGLLKQEMRALGSLVLACAEQAAVPAGSALAVDRERFAQLVTERIAAHPLITLIRQEVTCIPDGVTVIASGPLTSDALAAEIARLAGTDHLYFWDAIAPIVAADSIDFSIAFRASRYGRELRTNGQRAPAAADDADGDYINCPMTRAEYDAFVEALVTAETATLRDFELRDERFFEGCLPIEVLARRGKDALAFGPLRPVGLRDPRTGKRPYAVVQLRQDNVAGTLYNMVGFQTNLKFPEQDRVFRLIPGLQNAEFVRYGQMHRNTFINAPVLLAPTLRLKLEIDPRPIFFAGQIVGVEGYAGNAATGLLAGINAARALRGQPPVTLPPTTMLGALCHYVTHADPKHFQPMKANFGLLPPLAQPPRDKRLRGMAYAERALDDLRAAIEAQGILSDLAMPVAQ